MEKRYGYNGQILEVDLSNKSYKVIKKSEEFYRIYAGGSLMAAYFLMMDTKPKIDPLGEENRLIFASSIVAGNEAPGLSKFSVIAKSPLSNGIGEARCEGEFSSYLKGSSFDLIVFKGKSSEPVNIVIDKGNIVFSAASEIWHEDIYISKKWIKEKYGDNCQFAMIGEAGVNKVRYASIMTGEGNMAQRTGMGAVMGSKNLKSLIIKSKELPSIFDDNELNHIKDDFKEQMYENTLSMWQKEAPGFSASADLEDDETAYIGVENYKSNLKVKDSCYKRECYLDYYNGVSRCSSCPNDCIKILNPGGVPNLLCAIHQEVTLAFGPNLGIENLELVLEANVLCNRFGLDPVSLGFTISFVFEAYEKSLLPRFLTEDWNLGFGNEKDILKLIESTAKRDSELGNLMAEGSYRMARKIGGEIEKLALHVKGIEMVSFEPRTQTNLALGYAIAPIGPRYDICEHDWDFDVISGWEHTLRLSKSLGILKRIPMEKVSKIKVRNFKALYLLWSALDALNICIFASAPTRVLSTSNISKIIESITGFITNSYELMRYGERRNNLLRLYNIREGLTKDKDTLPKRFFEEGIEMGRFKGLFLDENMFKESISTLYSMFGWDDEGIPYDSTLTDYHLEWAIPLAKKLRNEE